MRRKGPLRRSAIRGRRKGLAAYNTVSGENQHGVRKDRGKA
jgi:hypothetical protein